MLRPSSRTRLTSSNGSAGDTRSPAEPLLSVRNLSVRYGATIAALTGVTLDVTAGSITAVLGGNGAGKTTLIRAISGNLSRHSGSVLAGDVLFDGRSLLPLSPERRTRAGVVQVPEGRRIFARLTVTENLRVGRFGNPHRHAVGDVDRIFEIFPTLAKKRRLRGALLSGGEQQMLAIGRALMASPRLLLLDEPTLGLAPLIIDQIGELLGGIRAEGTTLLLVEQNAGVALDLADTAYVLSAGSVALSGSSAQLRDDERVRGLYFGDESLLPDGTEDR
ncbi:MAG: transporter ATP-binding protein [Microbacteriaceae bacterium]|jgi:branched-chain amino acid transport system ATP-binding protein|nr:transporter ATP-binding protein [Microbacteriaceae bacterium]